LRLSSRLDLFSNPYPGVEAPAFNYRYRGKRPNPVRSLS
jgi:hypothetical protein